MRDRSSEAITRAKLIELAPGPFQAPPSFWDQLTCAYAQAHRHYHNLEHLEELASHFAILAGQDMWVDETSIYYAMLCHDAVYDIGAKDNEARSADLAELWHSQSLHHLPIDISRVRQLIEWTAVHGRLGPGDVDAEAALFLDCDMAILGASAERFTRYDQQIEAEQCQVHARWAYRLGRRAFVKALLKAPRIYLSEHFHAQLEQAARNNLSRL